MHALPLTDEVFTIHQRDGAALGYVEWYPKWREYVFMPGDDVTLSGGCMRDLALFLSKCANKRRKNLEGI
jgi:hypothetical protein